MIETDDGGEEMKGIQPRGRDKERLGMRHKISESIKDDREGGKKRPTVKKQTKREEKEKGSMACP